MKFLILSNNDLDGVGQHVDRLNSTLNNLGHESTALVLHKSSQSKNIFKIKKSLFTKFFYYPLNFLKKNLNKLFSFGFSGVNIKIIKENIYQADIILIYTFSNLLSIDNLEELLQSKKIVYFRPLDMELASGGCHVNFDDEGQECWEYQKNCSNCPQLNFINFFNISSKIFLKKKRILEKYSPKIFVENTFTKRIYEKSHSCKNLKITPIFLGINQNRTKDFKKLDSRKKLKLDPNDKILLYGSFNLDAKHKGGEIIHSILEILSKKVNHSNKVKLITFGRKNNFQINIKNIEWLHLGVIKDDYKLNLLYRAADLMLSPSIGCNGPHMVVEAICNNLPVICFDQGVAIDSIINGINGFRVKCFDKELFANKIYESLFKIKFDFNNNQNMNIKRSFSSINEANKIIDISKNDLNKNT